MFQAVKNKEIDMKGAAELLGVSYGTLYGRYRESFGYLKHAWNVTGRPQRKTNLWWERDLRVLSAINILQERPGHEADPGVDEVRRHQHQAGGRGPGHGAGYAGLPAGGQGEETLQKIVWMRWGC